MARPLLVILVSTSSLGLLASGSTYAADRPAANGPAQPGTPPGTPRAVEAPASATTWRCGALEVSTRYSDGTMDLTIGNTSFAMRQVRAASGAKFESMGDPSTTAWEKGDTMTLVVKGRAYPECLRAGPAMFRALGNEPGWRLDIAEGSMTLLTDAGRTRIVMPQPAPETLPGATAYAARDDRHTMAVTISDQVCMDTMSGMPYPKKVVVRVDGKELDGCGGDPAALLQGVEWVIESIDGVPVLEGSKVTLAFGGDGRVWGSASCDTYTAGYALSGDGLSIEQPAGTMRMCETGLMNQERAFLKMLGDVRRFEIRDGALILLTADRRIVKARRG